MLPNFDLSSIEIRMPTDEELQASHTMRYERVAEYMIDQWPESVRALSFPTKMVEVDPEQMMQLYDGESPEWKAVATELAEKLDEAMDWQPFFIRLNSRSPKDAVDLPITCSGRQAIYWISQSMRCMDDTATALYAKKPMYICLRKAQRMHKDGEFRCFAKDGQVIAASRYFYDDTPMNRPAQGVVLEAAKRFYDAHLQAHYPDVVFDLYAPGSDQEILIELNPYGLSDPCLFGSYDEVEKGGERLG